jgi:hypothetical protein
MHTVATLEPLPKPPVFVRHRGGQIERTVVGTFVSVTTSVKEGRQNFFKGVSWQNGYCGVLLIPFFRGSIPLDALNFI